MQHRRYTVSVEERPDSRHWQARCYLEGEGGKARRWSTGIAIGNDRRVSEREATRAAEERADKLAREVLGEVANEKSLDKVAEAMLALKEADAKRPRAVDALAFNLDKHVKPYFGETRDVRTIRRRDLEGFKAHLRKDGYAPTSINNALTAIRQVLKYACMVEEWIEAVPHVENVPVPRSTAGRPISEAQAVKFLAAFEPAKLGKDAKRSPWEEREFNLFLLHTGLRKFEALAIRWDWINWKRRELHIEADVRKGGKPQRAPTALDAVALQLLRERRGRADQPSKGRVWWQLKTYDEARQKAAKRSGIEGFRHHDARHTRATWLGARGATGIDLRDAMNWETLAMVGLYTHPDRVRLHGLANAVGKAVTGAVTGHRGSTGKDGEVRSTVEITAVTGKARKLRSL